MAEVVQIKNFLSQKEKVNNYLLKMIDTIVEQVRNIGDAHPTSVFRSIQKITGTLEIAKAYVDTEVKKDKEFKSVFEHDKLLGARVDISHFPKFTKRVRMEGAEAQEFARIDKVLLANLGSLRRIAKNLRKIGSKLSDKYVGGGDTRGWQNARFTMGNEVVSFEKVLAQLKNDVNVLNRIVKGDYISWSKI